MSKTNIIDAADRFNGEPESRKGRRSSEKHIDAVRAEPLQDRVRARETLVRRTRAAFQHENFQAAVVRNPADNAMTHMQAARQIARPAIQIAPPEVKQVSNQAPEVGQIAEQPRSDSIVFLDDARHQVRASLPEQENYIPDHPRVSYETADSNPSDARFDGSAVDTGDSLGEINHSQVDDQLGLVA